MLALPFPPSLPSRFPLSPREIKPTRPFGHVSRPPSQMGYATVSGTTRAFPHLVWPTLVAHPRHPSASPILVAHPRRPRPTFSRSSSALSLPRSVRPRFDPPKLITTQCHVGEPLGATATRVDMANVSICLCCQPHPCCLCISYFLCSHPLSLAPLPLVCFSSASALSFMLLFRAPLL